MSHFETNLPVNESQFSPGDKLQWSHIGRFMSKVHGFAIALLVIMSSVSVSATHIMGNEISYRHIDSLKYELVFAFYRDCRGVSINNPSSLTSLKCLSSGKTQGLSLTLQSIEDITPVCATQIAPCYPVNTYGTGKGIEMHIYTATVNFADSMYQPFYKCGKIIIQTGQCCRNGAITTGAANANFYNYAMMDFSKTDVNSSPVIRSFPNVHLCCSNPVRHYFGAGDNEDFDSLSYHITPPLSGYNVNIAYTPPFSYNKPFTVYDPYKTGQIYPNANPPIGFYFDSINGGVIFTPAKCDESTVLAYEIREWRKDTAGVYQHIGSVRRDMQYWVENCTGNNPPIITGTFNHTVCEGDSVSFNINSSDKVFVLPPPNPTPDPDTVRLSWDGLFSDATMTLQDTGALRDTVRFSWRAKSKSGTNNTYSFFVTARDNACPRNSLTSQVITIRVLAAPSATLETAHDKCGTYGINAANLANASNATWQLFDAAWNPITDTAIGHFKSGYSYTSSELTDSLRIKKNGTYHLRLRIWEEEGCSRDLWDTLVVFQKYRQLFSLSDTLMCGNWSMRLYPDRTDTTDFKHFEWNTGAADTFSSIRINPKAGIATYILKAVTHEGCMVKDTVFVESGFKPVIDRVSSDTFCPPINLVFYADSMTDNGWLELNYSWENGDTNVFRAINSPGTYALTATNVCGSDSVEFTLSEGLDPDFAPEIIQIEDKILCDPIEFELDAENLTNPRDLELSYLWENGDTSPVRTITDTGTFRLMASNQCGADTMEFTLRQDLKPELAPIPDDSICLPGSVTIRPVDLHDSGLVKRSYLWNDGDTSSEKVINTGGLYEVVVSSMCGSDTSRFRIHATGTPDVNLGPDSTLRAPFSIKLVADTVEGSYLWGSGDTTKFVYAQYYGKFWVTVTNRCGTSSDTIYFIRSASVGELTHGKINLIPNPNNGRFVLQSDGVDFNVLRLTDITGKEHAFTLDKSVNTAQYLTLVNATPGIYFLEIEQDGYLYVYRFAVW